MKIKLRTLAFELLLFLLLIGFIQTASAYTTIESGDTVIIDYTVEDDVYAAGGSIVIEGTIVGDLVAAGGEIDIRGNVTQDVIITGGEVTITGNVGDDVRVAAGTLTVSGDVGDDIFSLSGETRISDSGSVGGDITSSSGDLTMLGNVDGNLTGSSGATTVGGTVGGNVDINTGKLSLLPDAYIAGDLIYRSPEKTVIPEGSVGKDIKFLKTEYDHEENRGFSIVSWIMGYLALLLIGLLAIKIWPEQIRSIAAMTTQTPGKAFLTGLVIIIGAMILSLLLLITLIGIPLSLILMALIILGLYTARLITSLWLGKYLFTRMQKESKSWHDLVLGLFVLLLVGEIPIIGYLVYLAATFIALGNIYFASRS